MSNQNPEVNVFFRDNYGVFYADGNVTKFKSKLWTTFSYKTEWSIARFTQNMIGVKLCI